MHWPGSSPEPSGPCGEGRRPTRGESRVAAFSSLNTFVFVACLLTSVAVAMESGGIAADTLEDSLESFLVSQLRVRTPADTLFLERVAGAVLHGRLPETVVRSTCEWAIQKADRSGARYPFPYFRSAIVLKARRLGVEF